MVARLRTLLLCSLAALVLLGMLGCSGTKSAEKPAGGTAVPTAEEAAEGGAEETAEAAPLAMGDKGAVGPYTTTAKSVERMTEIKDPEGRYDSQVAGDGKEFLIVTIDLANDTDAAWGTGPTSFKLVDGAGTEYNEFPTNTQDFIFNMPGPIEAKGSATTKIAYEVPKGATGLMFTFEPFTQEPATPSSVTWTVE